MIVGEGTGCMARNQLFHIKCFTCHKCGCQLQGQPFYPVEGKVINIKHTIFYCIGKLNHV